MIKFLIAAGAVLFAGAGIAAGIEQRTDVFVASRDHAAIKYTQTPPNDAVAALNRAIASGSVPFRFDPATGFLKSAMDALAVPVESQALVFSETSQQAPLIKPRNPRAIYFNDTVAIGWVRGGDLLELAAQDPE